MTTATRIAELAQQGKDFRLIEYTDDGHDTGVGPHRVIRIEHWSRWRKFVAGAEQIVDLHDPEHRVEIVRAATLRELLTRLEAAL